MAKEEVRKGDFGLPKRQVAIQHVVAIFDIVGFTSLDSNDDLFTDVSALQTQLTRFFIGPRWIMIVRKPQLMIYW